MFLFSKKIVDRSHANTNGIKTNAIGNNSMMNTKNTAANKNLIGFGKVNNNLRSNDNNISKKF